MKATHIDYQHPRHLRVEMDGDVFCLSPSHSKYPQLAKASLPKFGKDSGDFDLPAHSSAWRLGEAALKGPK